jgi:hypothetical protein
MDRVWLPSPRMAILDAEVGLQIAVTMLARCIVASIRCMHRFKLGAFPGAVE